MSDTSQVVATTREHDAFGNVSSHTGAWEGPFGYAGKFGYQSASIPGASTPDAGLQLLGHRTYDPSTGRFLTRDPIFDGRNWYSYGGGEANPLTQADPNGLATAAIAAPLIGSGPGRWIILGVGDLVVIVAGVIIFRPGESSNGEDEVSTGSTSGSGSLSKVTGLKERPQFVSDREEQKELDKMAEDAGGN